MSFTSTAWAAAMQRFLQLGRATRTSADGRGLTVIVCYWGTLIPISERASLRRSSARYIGSSSSSKRPDSSLSNGYAQSASPGVSTTNVVRGVTEIGNMACLAFNGTEGR
jgi:hypothetical protein